jgi:hypothetical protein
MIWLLACAQTDVPVQAAPTPVEPAPIQVVEEVAPTPPDVPEGWLEHWLPWDTQREELTVAYLEQHHGTPLPEPLDTGHMVPALIVLHWTAGNTVDGAWNTFAPTLLRGRPNIAKHSQLNVSSHFIVAQDGTVHRTVPPDVVARHVIGLNHVAVGVENVGGPQLPLTDAQVAANVDIVRWVVATHPTVTHLIGHHEYRELEGTPLFRETDDSYRTTKPDPGDDFMGRVRDQVADLELKGPPEG